MIRSVSYGGGVQSTALLVLAAQGRIDFNLFLFANTGEDSEDEDTLAYVRTIAAPYARGPRHRAGRAPQDPPRRVARDPPFPSDEGPYRDSGTSPTEWQADVP